MAGQRPVTGRTGVFLVTTEALWKRLLVGLLVGCQPTNQQTNQRPDSYRFWWNLEVVYLNRRYRFGQVKAKHAAVKI